jgi:FG-GAP-like repeat
MKHSICIVSLALTALGIAVVPAEAQVNVIQHHNHDSRDGLYVDPAFTQSAAGSLTRDLGFNGTVAGNVYAQPLYIDDGPGGRPTIIAATESNNVYALDAINGSIIWQQTDLGTPVPLSNLPCGNIDPMGITGTPVIDLGSRSLFLDAMTTPDGGTTKKHLIYSLNLDTGAINPGWPVDVNASATYNGMTFTSSVQGERGALSVVGNILYVPYGGHAGDCGTYHGWLVGVPVNNPASVTAWATSAIGGGAWSTGGVASDGSNLFMSTGNTFNTGGNWSGGEAVIRFQPGPIFTGQPSDYWAPTNWQSLDQGDIDLGGSGPLLVDVPGATPSSLIVALGKDGNAYLLNRGNLGGITAPVASLHVSGSSIIQAAATYRTNQGTYVVFRANGNTLSAFRINAGSPPTITTAWTVSQSGCGSPFVTSTGGTNNTVVWAVGASGDQKLHGYDGDTGAVVFAGGGANETMGGTHSYNTTGIAARGRIYVGTDNKVYAFVVPGGTPTPTPTPSAATADFNGDGHTDWVIHYAATRQTAIVYMNDNVVIGAAFGPSLVAGWTLRGVADFNLDNHPDYALFAPNTFQTAIWYLSGPTFIGSAIGPTLPSGWALVAMADFNGDGHPDWVVRHATGQTALVYLNNNVVIGAAFAPPLPNGWSLTGVADFNGDGHPDYALFISRTGQTVIGYLSGPTVIGAALGPTLPSGWALVATADFNGDGKPDYVLYQARTRQTAIVYMNNNVAVGAAFGPTLPAGWTLAAP